ncbi:hypothetical protein KAI87_13865, partial [Myxococcota bacterium]|nr:hypothetical protein [Myxococcota bacterium]
AGAEDCDTSVCTAGCTANGYCAGGSPIADPCDITDSTEHALCRTQLGNDQSYCTAYLECEVDMSGCGFPYIDDGNGACIPDTNACIMTNWDGDCPTSSEYCNRGVCTTHTFDCYVGLNELCTNDKYCDPHGSCALSSGYECDPTDPAAHSLCQTETVNMDSYCISNPACDREPIGCASMEDCYLAGFGDNFACFDGTCQPRCVAGQNGACPPNYECKDIDLDTDFVEYACVAATSGTYCLHDPNTICTAPGTQCMMSQICMDYANDTHGQCGPMGECPDYNVCVSQDGCYPGTVYDWNDTVTGEFRHDYAIYCDAIANCPEGHHCVYDDLGQTVCRPECFESACNSYLDMNCTSMLSIDDTNLHYVCMKDHDACAEAEWVWTNMNSDTGNLVNHNEEYEPLQGIGFSADGFPFKVVTNGNIIGLLGKDSSGNTRLWMDYFDNQSSGAAFEKLITISSRDSWVSHPVISPNSDSIAIMCDNFAIFGGSTGTACFNLGAPDDSVLALVDFSAASPDTKIYTAATTPHLKEVYYGLAYNGQTIAMSLTTDNTPANPFIARVSADGNFSAIGPTINKYPSVNAEAIPVFQSDSTMFWVAASSDDSTSWGYPDTLHFTDFDDPTNDGKVAFSLSDIRNIINMQASKNVVLLNTYDYQVASDNFQLGFITQTPDTHNLSGITSNRVGPMGWTGMPKMERFADLKIAVMNEHIVVWARETSESDGFQLMASDLRACTRGALSAEMPGSFVIAEQRDSAFCGGKEATLESFDVVADSLGGFALVYAAACKDGTNYVSHKIFTRRFSGQPPQL